ncbi:hypothetical protein Tco_1106662 [Tanacetum coccineum]
MSNTNNNMQSQTSSALHNAIMEADGKDRPPMLALGKIQNHRPRPYAKFQALNQSIKEVVKNLMKRNLEAEVKVLLEGFDCN